MPDETTLPAEDRLAEEGLAPRPHLTRRDEDAAMRKVGVTPADHDAAGKADAIDTGVSTGTSSGRPERDGSPDA